MSLRLLVVIGFLCFGFDLFAQRYEAENATLSGGATKHTSQGASGGQYVAQNEGSLTWSINVQTEGHFDFIINAAAPNGNKINVFSLDGNTVDFALTLVSFSSQKVAASVRMSAGAHTIKILKSWGYINIDYLEMRPVSAGSRFSLNTDLVTPQPIANALKLYRFLYDNYGRKVISGVMTLNSFDETQWLKANTGKEPALVGLDFMHSGRNYNWYNDRQPVEDAKTYYDRNGIPAICWHWRDPLRNTEEFYTNKTSFDVSRIFDETSPEYKAMLADIDYISGLLKELQEQGVPVIWRPLHEAAGGWFWWGAKGAAPCKKLYQVMFDRMVNYHGLKNLIWVWTREPNDDDWYPGDAYVDIVGRDLYRDGVHNSHVLEWSNMNERYDKKKIVTLSECGSFPDPDQLSADGAAWSWFMPWYGAFVRDAQYNSPDLWKKAMNHEYVITLDEMPDLRTYEGVTHEPEPDPVLSADRPDNSSSVQIFPTIVNDSVYIHAKSSIGRVEIHNAQGVRIHLSIHHSTKAVISLVNEKPGMFLVKIRNQPAVKIFKQ